MDVENINEVFKIGGLTAVNQGQIAHTIAAELEAQPFSTPEHWAEFAITAVSTPNQATSDSELHSALAQAAAHYDQIWVSMDLADSSLPLLSRIKKNFHSLTLFYVNRLGEKQTRFNDRILRAANALAGKQLQQEAEIAELKEQIAQLQAAIAEMEQKD